MIKLASFTRFNVGIDIGWCSFNICSYIYFNVKICDYSKFKENWNNLSDSKYRSCEWIFHRSRIRTDRFIR